MDVRVWRWPALVAIPLLLVAAAVASRGHEASTRTAPGLAQLAMPTVAPAGALGSTWFCAGGSAAGGQGDSAQEHVLVIANTSSDVRKVRLTAYPSGAQPVVRDLEVAGSSRVDVRLRDLLEAAHVAALVEVDGGGVAVQHEVRSQAGRSVAPCASAPSASWYFPAGTTRAGSQLTISLFNPFPTDAVVDITFDADDGSRSPEAFQGLVVPAGSVVPVDVGAVVTLRQELATSVHVRSGRLVVDQLQSADGLSVVLGSVLGEEVWIFPGGTGTQGYGESVVLYNPGDAVAEVEVQALLDDSDVNGIAEPFQVSVGPRRYEVVDVLADGRVPAGIGHSIIVRSTNGVGVVAERSVAGVDGARRGLALTMGSPATATRWVAAAGGLDGATASSVVVVNPSSSGEARVRVEAVGEGGRTEIEEVAIPPGGRRVVQLQPGPGGPDPSRALLVESDAPVVAEVRFAFRNDSTYAIATPYLDSITTPTPSSVFVPSFDLGTVEAP